MSYITIPPNYYLQYYNSQTSLYYNPTKYYLQYYNSQMSYITIPLNTIYNIITLR